MKTFYSDGSTLPPPHGYRFPAAGRVVVGVGVGR